MQHFIFGLLGMIGGVLMIRYVYDVKRFVGTWDWAERYLGSTYTALRLIGLAISFWGFLYFFGLWETFVGGTAGKVLAPSVSAPAK